MARIVPTGIQSFLKLRQNNLFYVDKTGFIRDWWKSYDDVTLITRPRRFGKTLMLDTVRTFFSPEFAGMTELFEGLAVWQEEEFRRLQGTVPVIFITFADIKYRRYEETVEKIKESIADTYSSFAPVLDTAAFSSLEKKQFEAVSRDMPDGVAHSALRNLAKYLQNTCGQKPIILLDEYDTPLQEAWLAGYWDELVQFMRVLFNSTFKTNPYLERGLLTGITRVSKESIFSDMNNIEVVGITSDLYADCFGFTEEEVFSAMDENGLTDRKEVKKWYDGFIFGSRKEIYNPWSIINYLKKKKFEPYWAQTSSNALVGTLIAQADSEVKEQMSSLLKGESITATLDEQIVFSQITEEQGALWSLFMASGYVKPLSCNRETEEYEITVTNYEIHYMLEKLISGWFNKSNVYGSKFRTALLRDNIDDMNDFMSDIAEKTFSFFDTNRNEPERFYHAFVLGLIVDLKDQYEIYSNRESGFGRYDIIMCPKVPGDHGIIIEFKTMRKKTEHGLGETCQNALTQIHRMHYIDDLLSRGLPRDSVYAYGFAFHAKEVLICGGPYDFGRETVSPPAR